MRILEITCEPILHGGQEQFLINLIDNMREEATIDVLTPYQIDNDGFVSIVERRGGSVHTLGAPFMPGKSRKFLLKDIGAFLSERDYDVVHIHSGSISALTYAARAAREKGVRQVIVHSHSTSTDSIKHKLVKRMFSRELKKYPTDYLACSYEAGMDKFPEDIVEKKLRIIKNGVDPERFARNDETRKRMRTELGIPEEDFVIGHVGRFSFEKNHGFLIDVFGKVAGKNNNARLLLIGDGDERSTITDKVRGLDLGDRVIFTGNVDNVQDHYHVMDVFVLPSIYEGFPFVALEAQAAGLPCILSDGVAEETAICPNVRLLSVDDEEEWVKALTNVEDLSLCDGSSIIREKGYDVKTMADHVAKIYGNEADGTQTGDRNG